MTRVSSFPPFHTKVGYKYVVILNITNKQTKNLTILHYKQEAAQRIFRDDVEQIADNHALHIQWQYGFAQETFTRKELRKQLQGPSMFNNRFERIYNRFDIR